MWLLKIWLDPGDWVPSSRRCTWWIVPALRGGTEAPARTPRLRLAVQRGGRQASSALPGQAAPKSAVVDASDVGGMICE
jgi:hypothetical protein